MRLAVSFAVFLRFKIEHSGMGDCRLFERKTK